MRSCISSSRSTLRIIRLFTASLIAAFAMASCGSTASAPTAETSTTIPASGLINQNQINYAAPYLPSNFNANTPAGDTGVTRQVMAQIWPSAFSQNSRYDAIVNSSLLNSAELVSTNPEKIVYQINPKAKWSDGVPISATDFIYNWKAQSGNSKVKDLGGQPYLSDSTTGYSDIRSVTGSNSGKTVTVIFRKLFSEWEYLFSSLAPAHIASKVGWNSGFENLSPSLEVSGGPYQIGVFLPGKEIQLVRNPKYWGRSATVAALNFLDDSDPSKYSNQFENESLNLVDTPAHDLLYSDIQSVVGVSTFLVPSLTIQELLFNTASGPLADPKVRQAIALSLDRKTIAYDALGSYLPHVSPAGNNIYAPGTPQYQNDGRKYDSPNPTAAISLLTADGYTFTSGSITKNGIPLKLTISVDQANQQLLMVEQLIADQLAPLGIEVSEANYSAGELVGTVLPKGSYDMAIVGESGSPNATFNMGRYQSPAKGVGSDVTRFKSSEANALIQSASTQLDPGTSANVYNQLDKLIWKELPSVPLYSIPKVLAYSTGYNFIGASTRSSTIFWNANNWKYVPPS